MPVELLLLFFSVFILVDLLYFFTDICSVVLIVFTLNAIISSCYFHLVA